MSGTMPMQAQSPGTANERFKNSFDPWLWGSIAVATVLHFVALTMFPQMQTADLSMNSPIFQQVEIPPEVQIPPPPEQIQRPQVPVMSANFEVEADLTIPPVTFERNPVSELPPPTGRGVDVSRDPIFTPYEVKPELRDRAGFARLLERRYPAMLRDAGIGGTVVLWVHIDEAGIVRGTRVTQSSGYEQLDEAARAVMVDARFTPALNRDQRVPVWIQIPVTFQTR
jgi:periplasmic protein TonB